MLHGLQMEVATTVKRNILKSPSIDVGILVVNEVLQEHSIGDSITVPGKNVAMEIVIEPVGLGTISTQPTNAKWHFLPDLVTMYVLCNYW